MNLCSIDDLDISAFTIPTQTPEADGTFAWTETTIVIVEAWSGDVHGLGYSYADAATAELAQRVLKPVVLGHDALSVPAAWIAMVRQIRNLGRPGNPSRPAVPRRPGSFLAGPLAPLHRGGGRR